MREELLHLLSISATLSGVCVTVVALMHAFESHKTTVTVVDDMFAICALLFLVCTYLIFSVLRLSNASLMKRMVMVVDAIFLASMTCMTLSAFIMVYTVW